MLPRTSYHSGNSPDSPERPSCRNIDVNSINKIRIFAQRFKELRHKYGYSQADVAQEVLLRYNFETCDEQIFLFETSSLAFEEMSTMKTFLEKWVLEIIECSALVIKLSSPKTKAYDNPSKKSMPF